jgi:hypothetical protein
MAGYPYTSHQFIYNEPNVQFSNTLPMSNVSSYFASAMNPYVNVARFDTSRHIASASNYSNDVNYANYNSEFNMQKPLLNNMHALNFNDTSNIQHYTHTTDVQQVQKSVNMYQGQTNMVSLANSYGTPHARNFTNFQQGVSSIYSSAGYLITSRNMLVNEKIGYANSSRLTSYSQPLYASQITNGVEVANTLLASLENVNNHDLAVNVHHNYSQINENSASMYLDEEVKKEDLPEEMRQELDQILAQFQRDFLYQVGISKKNKNDSDLSNSSVIMATEPNSVHFESVTTKESSLAVEEHINQ